MVITPAPFYWRLFGFIFEQKKRGGALWFRGPEVVEAWAEAVVQAWEAEAEVWVEVEAEALVDIAYALTVLQGFLTRGVCPVSR